MQRLVRQINVDGFQSDHQIRLLAVLESLLAILLIPYHLVRSPVAEQLRANHLLWELLEPEKVKRELLRVFLPLEGLHVP